MSLLFTDNAASALPDLRRKQVFLVYPDTCGEMLLDSLGRDVLPEGTVFLPVKQGEQNKTLEAAQGLWTEMLKAGATRRSLIVNLGGGMTTDLGGFAAANWMRGIRYINIPTTLLAMVDAATGGKTAVNFPFGENGEAGMVKNLIGAFHEPLLTVVSPQFLATLPTEEIFSGWGEMLKHALLSDRDMAARYLVTDPLLLKPEQWLPLIQESVAVKQKIVKADPHEHGVRRMLNLGHTVGHALEAHLHLRHGHAVAIGLVTALVLSNMRHSFPPVMMQGIAIHVRAFFPAARFSCKDYDALLDLMHHDKKAGTSGKITFSLLKEPGDFAPPDTVPDAEILTALDITRDLLGI